ncbi:MAG: 6-bladed beta-propeller [Bacteroidales bacterium]|nr:6-bladed beta-propeller [Bacteroidales bacterium]
MRVQKKCLTTLMLILILEFNLLLSCSKKNKDYPLDVEVIKIDVDKYEEIADASFFVDTDDFEIIPLETSDSCLIGNVTRVYLKKDKIIVYDEVQKAAFIFNKDGSYYSKVLRLGNGPGEYPPVVNDIVVTDNFIGVLVPAIQKIKFYNFEGEFVKDISLNGSWAYTFFTFDENKYYLINGWGRSDQGKYHLFTLDEKGKLDKFLPFESNDEINRGWGLENYYSLFQNRALVIYSSIDSIYSVSPDQKIAPKYFVEFTKRKISKELAEGDGRTALEYAIKNDYFTGVTKIMETTRYLVLMSSGADMIVYDKTAKEVKSISTIMVIPEWDNFSIQLGAPGDIQEDKIIYTMEAIMPQYYKDTFNKNTCKDKRFAEEYSKILNAGFKDTDNPILFIFNVKK